MEHSKQHQILEEISKSWEDNIKCLDFDDKKCINFINWIYDKYWQPAPKITIFDSPIALIYAANTEKFSLSKRKSNLIKMNVLSNFDSILSRRYGQTFSDNEFGFDVKKKIFDDYYDNNLHPILGRLKEEFEINYSKNDLDIIKEKTLSELDIPVRLQNKLEMFYFSSWCDIKMMTNMFKYDAMLKMGLSNNLDNIKEIEKGVEYAKCGLFTSIHINDKCFVSRPPVFLNKDDDGLMHCTVDQAVKFNDGFGLYFVHGINFTKEEFEKYVRDEKATGEEIISVENLEKKGALIKLYGYEKIIDSLKDKVILDTYTKVSKVTGKTSTCQLIEFDFSNRITARMVKVEDHSVHKITVIGVPRIEQTTTCLGALAWTFGIDTEKYVLENES